MPETAAKYSSSTPSVGPMHSLLEVLLHELSNPVQAARTTLNLIQVEDSETRDNHARFDKLASAFERIAVALQSVQSVKEAALRPAVPVPCKRLLSNIQAELSALGVPNSLAAQSGVERWLLCHEAALPVLVARWSASNAAGGATAKLVYEFRDGQGKLAVNLRQNGGEAITRTLTLDSTAGYAVAIGQFMHEAGGAVELCEDDSGACSLVITFREYDDRVMIGLENHD